MSVWSNMCIVLICMAKPIKINVIVVQCVQHKLHNRLQGFLVFTCVNIFCVHTISFPDCVVFKGPNVPY
jgi:hypothetical protein